MNVICAGSVVLILDVVSWIVYLHPILQFGYQRTFRYEIEQLSLGNVGQWNDERYEE